MKYPLFLCLLLACGMAATAQTVFMKDFRTGDPGTESWNSLGPAESEYGPGKAIDRGRINALWVNPNDSNCILAGSDGGGLWKSNDDGKNWRCLTDNSASSSSDVLGMYGISSIAVDPEDTNVMYLAIYMSSQYDKSTPYPGFGLGLVYTTDGGSHWYMDGAFNSIVNTEVPGTGYTVPVTKIAYAPGTHELYAIWGNYALYKPDYASPWQDITTGLWWGTGSPAPNITCLDLQFSNLAPGKAIISIPAFDDHAYLWMYDPGTASWSDIAYSLPSPYTLSPGDGAIHVSMSANDTAYMEVTAHDGADSLVILLVKTSINIATVQMLNNNFSCSVWQFAVSPGNSHVIYTANYTGSCAEGRFWRSTDEGATFTELSASSSADHDDGRCLNIWQAYQHPDSDIVYFGCDGGIVKKRMNNANTESITGAGLAIDEFYGFGNTEEDETVMVAGAQDNGEFNYMGKRHLPWYRFDDGDAENTKMMRDNMRSPIGEREAGPAQSLLYRSNLLSDTVCLSSLITVDDPVDASHAINRPMYMSKDDVAYVGYNHIFYTTPPLSGAIPAWSRAFHADPIDSGGIFYAKKAVDFYIDENDNDTAYIAYKDWSGPGTNPAASYFFGKLFYSHSAMNPTSPEWQNISPSIVTDYNINTIAVDPENSSRIWVGFGSLNTNSLGDSSSVANRVWYSDNAGGSWHDVSAGLPPQSVNKLLYRKGSDDEIYAGTDAGVYVWNKSLGAWQSYNAGLPPCVVMDMELNYCANKLRLVTYGRGMWETAIPDIAAPKPLLITGTTTLSPTILGHNNIYMQSSIDVQAGGTLIIHDGDTLHMPKDALISVEPGGRLLVAHGMITNGCENCLWHGIQARGTCWQPQTPAYQGYVIIEDGSTIANAHVGVANSDESVVWSTDGGVIQCSNSRFIDNTLCASFREYDNFTGEPLAPVLHPNISYFSNCSFLLDNDYKRYAGPMKYMVSLVSVEGINFIGCQWDNMDTVSPNRATGEGIHAVNSGFNVSSYCSIGSASGCLSPYRSRFSGFTNGINVGGLWQLTLAVSIDNTDFDSVSNGVYVDAFNDVSVTNCHFNVGHGGGVYDKVSSSSTGTVVSSCNQNTGIFNQNSQRFRIEGNTFQGFPNHVASSWYNFGTVIANSGAVTNVIYRNSYDSLNAAVFPIGVNRGPIPLPPLLPVEGLKILCNTFTNNVSDIEVANDGSSSFPQGIAPEQGLPTGSPAGNTFFGSTYNIVNNCSYVNYYYHASSTSGEQPVVVSGVSTVPETYVKSCPATTNGGGTITSATAADNTSLAAMKQAVYNSKATLAGMASEYNGLMDLGKESSFVSTIATSKDTAALYSTLKNGSPYLSEALLDTVANYMALPYYSVTQLLLLNPDDLRDNDFLSYMNSAYHFSQTDMDSLVSHAHDLTARTWLEDSISRAQDTIAGEMNLIMLALKTPNDTGISISDTTGSGICLDTTSMYYGIDSNSFYAGLDSIDTWLQNTGSVSASYERVGYYYFMGQYDTANEIFSSINSIVSGDPAAPGRVEYNTYVDIWSMIYGAQSNGGSAIFQLDSSEVAALGDMGSIGFTYNRASIVAYNISDANSAALGSGIASSAGVIWYYPCPAAILITPGGSTGKHSNGGTSTSPQPIININANDAPRTFSAYPNPASGVVTFTYNVQDGGSGITIVITNIVGEKVAVIQTENNAGSTYWNTGALPAGVYIYQAGDAQGSISKGKIVVER